MFIPLHLGLLCPSPHERGNGSLGFWFLAIPVLCALAGSSVLFPLQGLVTLSYLPRAISTSRHLIDEEETEFYANLQPELKTPVLMQPQKKAVCYLVIPLYCNPSLRICLVSLFQGAQNTSHMLSH